MGNKSPTSNGAGHWVGVGTAIGATVFAVTRYPVWIGVGVAIGAALSWRPPSKKSED